MSISESNLVVVTIGGEIFVRPADLSLSLRKVLLPEFCCPMAVAAGLTHCAFLDTTRRIYSFLYTDLVPHFVHVNDLAVSLVCSGGMFMAQCRNGTYVWGTSPRALFGLGVQDAGTDTMLPRRLMLGEV